MIDGSKRASDKGVKCVMKCPHLTGDVCNYEALKISRIFLELVRSTD